MQYGGVVCACCGETEFSMLTIDHINQDGAAHRREVSTALSKIFAWLKQHGWPDGYRVLCFNCNIASYRNGGVCPHKSKP
jgi:hypothetical protein